MRLLRAILVLLLVLVGVLGIIVPIAWVHTASNLPTRIESALEIELNLRQQIESERYSMKSAIGDREKQSIKWDRPEFRQIPKAAIAFYITETGCPTFFDAPPEGGLPWLRRLFASLDDQILDGDGACELIMARRLARRLGAQKPFEVMVAADRIHRFLSKDELVAFDLSSLQFDRGIVGIEAAATAVFNKPLSALTIAEYAELQIALPPWGYWEDLKSCVRPLLIRQNRDGLVERLKLVGLISEEMAQAAIAADTHCK